MFGGLEVLKWAMAIGWQDFNFTKPKYFKTTVLAGFLGCFIFLNLYNCTFLINPVLFHCFICSLTFHKCTTRHHSISTRSVSHLIWRLDPARSLTLILILDMTWPDSHHAVEKREQNQATKSEMTDHTHKSRIWLECMLLGPSCRHVQFPYFRVLSQSGHCSLEDLLASHYLPYVTDHIQKISTIFLVFAIRSRFLERLHAWTHFPQPGRECCVQKNSPIAEGLSEGYCMIRPYSTVGKM